jgi:hypothetical protein
MKSRTLSILLFLKLFSISIYSQTIVRYPSGSYFADIVNSNISVSKITENSGITPISCSTWLSALDFNQSNLSDALANGDFWEFTMTPNIGYNLNITNITIADNGTDKSNPSPFQQYGVIYKIGTGSWVTAATYNANNLGLNICTSSTSGTNLNINISTNLSVTIGLVYYGTTDQVQAKFGTLIVSGNAILPVKLIDFNGITGNNLINLDWSTASELNNSGFEIEKSKNGKDWEIIDFVEGSGTTSEISEYQYQDVNPYSGINYYRLKQFDFDGAFEHSKVITVEYNNSESSINAFPNPSSGLINLQIDNPLSQRIKIMVLDNLGRKVWESIQVEGELNLRKEIEIEGNGIYCVSAQIGDKIHYERVIITDEK